MLLWVYIHTGQAWKICPIDSICADHTLILGKHKRVFRKLILSDLFWGSNYHRRVKCTQNVSN
jgi:hypothetical protein